MEVWNRQRLKHRQLRWKFIEPKPLLISSLNNTILAIFLFVCYVMFLTLSVWRLIMRMRICQGPARPIDRPARLCVRRRAQVSMETAPGEMYCSCKLYLSSL